MSSRAQASDAPYRAETPYRWNGSIVAIAASTGGVEAITRVLQDFPSDGPPVLVVQHMPGGGITGLFAHRIDRQLRPHVERPKTPCRSHRGWSILRPAVIGT